MTDLGLVEGPVMISSLEQDPNPNPTAPAKEPATPELGIQAANQGRFGLPTPDATPESIRIASGHHNQGFEHPSSQRDARPATPSISSRAPSAEETIINRDCSQHSIHSEATNQTYENPITPPASGYQDNSRSGSVTKSVFSSLISFLNLAKQRSSRADDARVQSTIDLIKSLPTIRRTRVGNLTTTLTAKQYGQLLRAIEESDDERFRSYFIDKLRFDYSRHKKQFEIRMPTLMHEETGDYIMDKVSLWRKALESSTDPQIADAAKTSKSSGSADVEFPFPRGVADSKSPDRSFTHRHCACEPPCDHPTLVIEVGWSQEMKDLQKKAETYICRSKGQIRTVVGIYMRKMHLAEVKNENRLYKAYMAGEVNEEYSYPNDERNKTGGASIIVWRARIRRNGTVEAVRVQDEEFRDEKGRAIGPVSLRLPLKDFICKGLADSLTGRSQEQFEISAEELCECIDEALQGYRRKRSKTMKNKAEEEKEKRALEAAQKDEKKKEARKREAAGRSVNDKGILGRISEQGRLVSARFKRQEIKG
ncbi:hypothetical protein GGR55DRAFT_688099 [Xylaria sp. FL0064]|nr:hypothetical protein GGR55DRAFT_688099 [Xylaria sp. FL0064]